MDSTLYFGNQITVRFCKPSFSSMLSIFDKTKIAKLIMSFDLQNPYLYKNQTSYITKPGSQSEPFPRHDCYGK